MILEYDTIYTEFPAELLDVSDTLLGVLHEKAKMLAAEKHAELLEGPPGMIKTPDHIRFAMCDYYVLKWPALRVFFSASEAESVI